MFKRLISAALVFGMAALAPPASAQIACADRAKIASSLETDFNEKLGALGLRSETEIVEVWTSDETGTWTIMVTHAEGYSCILASGTGWMNGLAVELLEEAPAY